MAVSPLPTHPRSHTGPVRISEGAGVARGRWGGCSRPVPEGGHCLALSSVRSSSVRGGASTALAKLQTSGQAPVHPCPLPQPVSGSRLAPSHLIVLITLQSIHTASHYVYASDVSVLLAATPKESGTRGACAEKTRPRAHSEVRGLCVLCVDRADSP